MSAHKGWFLLLFLAAAGPLGAAEPPADGSSPARQALDGLRALDTAAPIDPEATTAAQEETARRRQKSELFQQLRRALEEEAAAGGELQRLEVIQSLPDLTPWALEGAAFALRQAPDQRAQEPLKARIMAAGAAADEMSLEAFIACGVTDENRAIALQFLVEQFLNGGLPAPNLLKVVGSSGNQLAVTLLAQVLRNQNTSEEMRAAAIVGIRMFSLRFRGGMIPGQGVYVEPLLELYDQIEQRNFREELIRLAGRIGGEGAVGFLERVGSEASGRLRLVVVEQLTGLAGRPGNPDRQREAAIVLNGWLRDDPAYRSRKRILESYKQLNLIWTAPGLIILLGDEHEDLRLEAHRLLMELSGEEHEIDDIRRWMMWWAAWVRRWEEENQEAMPVLPE